MKLLLLDRMNTKTCFCYFKKKTNSYSLGIYFIFCSLFIFSSNVFSQETNVLTDEVLQKRILLHRQNQLNESTKDSINIKVNSEKVIPKSIVVIAEEPTFPVFYDTGNAEKDNEDYTIRKLKWIAENEETYKKLQNSSPYSEEQKKEIELKESLNKQKL